jgi:hypothetical protein
MLLTRARHAADPQQLVAQRPVHELVDVRELFQALLHAGMHARDQFQLRFAVVGGDVGMREGRAERRRVRGQREGAGGGGAQALLLDAAPDALQPRGRERAQRVVQFAHGNSSRRPLDVSGVGS